MKGILFLVVSLFSLAAAAAILWVNSRRGINQAAVLTLSLGSIPFLFSYMAILNGVGADPAARSPAAVLFWLRMNNAAFAFVPWAMWLMKNAILVERTSLFSLINRSWLWFSGSCLLAAVCFTDLYIPLNSTPANPLRGIGHTFFIVGMCVLFGLVFLDAYRAMRQATGVRRMEIQFFLFNSCAAGLLITVAFNLRYYLQAPSLVYVAPVVVIVLLSSMVWALTYHRVFDARQVIFSLGQRIAMLVILGGGALGIVRILSPFVGPQSGLVFGVVLAGVIVFLVNQVTRKWLGLDPDQLLAEPRAKIITWARTESDPEKLKRLFENFLRDWCQSDMAELLVAGDSAYAGRNLALANQGIANLCRQGWVTPEHLQRLRAVPSVDKSLALMTNQGLAAVIAVPRGSEAPSLLIALGSKHSLRPYTYPDITLLLNLAELMDNILTHAHLSNHAAKIAQMESAAMMSRGLAHDLNNLTTPVSTYLLHSEGRDKPGSPEAEVYHAARHSITVMQNYIRESLFFAKRLVPELKELRSDDMLSSIVRLANERAARRKVRLKVVPGVAVGFTADPALVQRLVLNLVNNAVDASLPEDVVEISAAQRNQEQICLAVADHGSGIPAENLRRIFDPYFTTKDTGDEMRGLGLGLTICRKIADLHGGSLEVSSVPGQGSTFTAVFPKKPATMTQTFDSDDVVADKTLPFFPSETKPR